MANKSLSPVGDARLPLLTWWKKNTHTHNKLAPRPIPVLATLLFFLLELDSNCHLRLKIASNMRAPWSRTMVMCHVTFSEFQSMEINQQLRG